MLISVDVYVPWGIGLPTDERSTLNVCVSCYHVIFFKPITNCGRAYVLIHFNKLKYKSEICVGRSESVSELSLLYAPLYFGSLFIRIWYTYIKWPATYMIQRQM